MVDATDDIIFNTGYYSINGEPWEEFPLQGDSQRNAWLEENNFSWITLKMIEPYKSYPENAVSPFWPSDAN